MYRKDHNNLHAKHVDKLLLTPENMLRAKNDLIKYNKSDKKREQNKRLAKEEKWHERFVEYNNSDLHKEHDKIRKEAQIKDWSNPEKRKERSLGMQVVIPNSVFESMRNEMLTGEIKNREDYINTINKKYVDVILENNTNDRLHKLKSVSRTIVERHINEMGFKGFSDYFISIKKNHKVLKIEIINESSDVYCMTVVGLNGEEDRHNFAICSKNVDNSLNINGLYIRNSIDQDFFIPVRDPSLTMPIETLPGANNLGEIQDIEYLQKKLLTSIRVPKAFLGFDEATGDG